MRDEIDYVRRALAAEGSDERLAQSFQDELKMLKELSLKNWTAGFRTIMEYGLDKTLIDRLEDDEVPPYLRYMIREGQYALWGFPVNDFRFFLRAIVEVLPSEEILEYDLTHLVEAGYVNADADHPAWAAELLTQNQLLNQKIIILTEGKSDAWALRGSVELLYPHLSDRFSFMDFDEVQARGGAASLVATVKAFIGAGVGNRVVALFDNDTAAKVALRSLRGIEIPPNVVIDQLPALELARDYPALGPNGIVTMDVNGLAGSLELYFGEDVLRDDQGRLRPVQWRGYDATIGQYHGEIVGKREVKELFRAKLEACLDDHSRLQECDWSGMRAILHHVLEVLGA